MDDYITTSAAASVASVSPDAEDIWVEGGSINKPRIRRRYFFIMNAFSIKVLII